MSTETRTTPDAHAATAETNGDGHERIDLQQFLSTLETRGRFVAAVRQTEIHRPPNAFNSDGWSAATVEGALKLKESIKGKRIAEVGVGAGTVSIIVAALNEPESIAVSDYVASHIETTARNAKSVLHQNDLDRFVFHPGSQNLLSWHQEGMDKLDGVIACIPQVVNRQHDTAPDADSNYIPDDVLAELRDGQTNGYDALRNRVASKSEFLDGISHRDFDLDLNVALLQQVRDREILNEGGFVCLTLGGRPGEEVLLSIIERHGFTAEIAHEKLVQQDPHTNIASLVAHEAQLQSAWPDYTFDFYRDEHGRDKIDAQTAGSLLAQTPPVPVYHKVLIVKCTLQSDAESPNS